MIKVSWSYFLGHFDTGPEPGDKFYVIYGDQIGYFIIALAPIVLKKYFWTFGLMGLAAIFYAWIFFAA